MDLTMRMEGGTFNYRVCALLLHDGAVLAMRDEPGTAYYYLPGGRVRLHETAEAAIVRELREELGVETSIVRPLWLNQGFFNEETTGERYHEICLYFLMDASGTELPMRGSFLRQEDGRVHRFEWLAMENLRERNVMPPFLARTLPELPDCLTLHTEIE